VRLFCKQAALTRFKPGLLLIMELLNNPAGRLLTCRTKLASLAVFPAKALQNRIFSGSWLNQDWALVIKP
jgi:hypothetical protein